MQAERDSNQQGEGSSPVQSERRFGRYSTKWFSFDLPVDPAHPMTLIVTFSNDNRGPSVCDVLVDGKKVGERTGPRRSPEQPIRFFDVEYKLPAELIADGALMAAAPRRFRNRSCGAAWQAAADYESAFARLTTARRLPVCPILPISVDSARTRKPSA
jgi:hypothetical protein